MYPTDVLVLDFESRFSVKKEEKFGFRHQSTIEYITDPRWEFLGCGFEFMCIGEAVDGGRWFTDGPDLRDVFHCLQKQHGMDLRGITVVAKNCKFDISLLQLKFGIMPKYTIDIDDLLRFYDARMEHGLAKVAKHFNIPAKGDTMQFADLSFDDIKSDPVMYKNLVDYTMRDIEDEVLLLEKVLPMVDFTADEAALARHTLELYVYPQFRIDFDLGRKIELGMRHQLAKVARNYNPKMLNSSIKIMREYCRLLTGCETAWPIDQDQCVPLKVGKPTKNLIPLTGEGLIPALAKNDDGTKLLLAHPNEEIRKLTEAKLAMSSWPTHFQKVAGIMRQARCNPDGMLRVPIHYYGCHTGRWTGGEKINLLNMGSGGRGSYQHPLIAKVRGMFRAPEGRLLAIKDSGQIEARKLAWMAGQADLLGQFANDADPYSVLATDIFKRDVWKWSDDSVAEHDMFPEMDDAQFSELKREVKLFRGFGKDGILGCVAQGTKVLAANGWTPVEDISKEWGVWDGEQWVFHDGVVDRGKKLCVRVDEVWLTPEHEVLTRDGWTTAVELSMSNLSPEWYSENSLLLARKGVRAAGLSPSNAVAPVVKHLLHTATILSRENLHAVMCVLKRHPGKLRVMKRSLLSPNGHVFLTEFVRSLADARLSRIDDMALEVSEYGPIGSMIESLFLNIWHRWKGSMIRDLRLTGSTTTVDTSLVISDSLLDSSKLETRNVTCYDILNTGPNKRFQAGNLTCSNCGYGMGAWTFYLRCLSNPDLRPLFDSGKYTLEFVEKIIKTYRSKYKRITGFWRRVEGAWRAATNHHGQTIVVNIPHSPSDIRFYNDGGTTFVRLPSGRRLRYRHAKVNKEGKLGYIHNGHLWGGTITENIDQASSRDLLTTWMLMAERDKDYDFHIVLHTYDEIVASVPESEAEAHADRLEEIMCTCPEWATGMPLSAEGGVSGVYKK